MEQQYENNLTSEERTLALISHLSIFFGGLIVPIIIYFIQKNKSKFVAFNALEALYFHIGQMIVGIIFVILAMIAAGIGVMASSTASSRDDMSPVVIILIIAAALFFFLILLGFIILAIIAAIKSYQGQIKKYPVVGNIAYKQVYGN